MINEEDFDIEIKKLFDEIVFSDSLQNKLNSLKFYISIEPDFEMDSLKVSLDYCNKYNFYRRICFYFQGKVPYLI